ncbi:BCD family MFS transporter [Chloroflexota bacterium]
MTLKRIQLGLIHTAVAISLVPINSTLNRVMITELSLSALLVAVLASLPYLFSPIQVAIGSFSDRHPIFGWRRTPYIFVGLALCVVGVVVAPQVAFLIVENPTLGKFIGMIAFGAWGMGYNLAAVSYLSLATEISGPRGRSRTIAVMFFMMIVGIILTSVSLRGLLKVYSPDALKQAFLLVGMVALLMGLVGLVGLERRKTAKKDLSEEEEDHTWAAIFRSLSSNRQAIRFFIYLVLLLTAILGQDILLEPFAAEAFDMPIHETSLITAIWGVFFLLSLTLGGLLENRVPKLVQARIAAWVGITAFGLIVVSGWLTSLVVFYLGLFLLGLATGLSTVSNLSLMLDMTVAGKIGMFIGAWGMANAISRLAGNLLSGVVRDTVTSISQDGVLGYIVVFTIEIGLLLVSLFILQRVDVSLFKQQAEEQLPYVERAAIANEG